MLKNYKGGLVKGLTLVEQAQGDVFSVSPTDRYGNPIDLTLDAFGRLRVSNPTTIFDSKQIDNANPAYLFSDTETNGTITYNILTSCTELLTDLNVINAVAQRQTRRYFNYQPGKSQKIDMTFQVGGSGTLVERIPRNTLIEVGYHDNANGVLFTITNTGSPVPAFHVRNNTSNDAYTQSNWNIDTLDGSGDTDTNPSGFEIDFTKAQIVSFSFEWLGVGGVLFSFVIDNRYIPCHFVPHANVIENVYMRNPNLPMRWRARNLNPPSGQVQLNAICGSVVSEGGVQILGASRADYITSAVTTATGTIRELLSIRLRCNGTADGNRVETHPTIFPEKFSVINTSNDTGNVVLLWNPTFDSAGTWAAPPGEVSGVQVCKSGRLITDVGTVLGSELFDSGFSQTSDLLGRLFALGSDYDTTGDVADIVTLGLVNTSGNNTTTLASLGWKEIL